jgi:HAMP domain-containing protein
VTALVVLIIAVVALFVVALVARRVRRPDGVASFRRQIDALSPEARRPVVDEVQRLEDEKKGDAADGS